MSNRGKWKRDKGRFDKNCPMSFACNQETRDAIYEYAKSRDVSISNAIRNLIDIGLQGKVDFRVKDIEAYKCIEKSAKRLTDKNGIIDGYFILKKTVDAEEWSKIESVLNRLEVNR